MTTITLTGLEYRAGDVLAIQATVTGWPGKSNPFDVEATGWISATTNHYDPSAYQPADAQGNRHRQLSAAPRVMTPAELRDYCVRVVVDQCRAQHGVPAVALGDPVLSQPVEISV